MNWVNKFKNNGAEIAVLILSIFSLFIGLVLSMILIVRMVLFDYNLKDSEIKLISVLIIGGLLGSVLNFVLKKVVGDYISKYITDDYIIALTKPEIDKRVHKIKNEIKEEVPQIIENLDEDKIQEDIQAEEDKSNTNLDTVIVPVAKSYGIIIQRHEYICPVDRHFKSDLRFVAFYRNKKIEGWGEIEPGYPKDDINKNVKVFKFSKLIEKVIPHLSKGPFVQNKMYCNIDKLKRAQNTSEIRPEVDHLS